MSSVEILLTTTAFESSLGAEQGKIMARAMSDHIDHTGEFKFREVRSGWGVCEGPPEAVAKFECLSFLHRAPVLKGLAVFVEKEKSGSTTVLLDLGKMNPREFYSVCLVAGHPPILIKPHVDDVGNILKSHFDIAFGLDFFKTRIQDVFDDEILVKELLPQVREAPIAPPSLPPPPPPTTTASLTKGFLGLGKRRRELSAGGGQSGQSAGAQVNVFNELRYYSAQMKIYQNLMDDALKRL